MGCCASSKVQDVGDLRDVECLQRTPAAAREASAVLGRSFAGTETTPPELAFEWCSGGTWESPARGREALAWIMRYLVEESFAAGPKGAIVACRGAGGDLVGVACLMIYRGKPVDGPCLFPAAFARTGFPKGEAATYTNTDKNQRLAALTKASERLHKAHAPGPHVYVRAVAVDPGSQGRGVGGKLMRAAVAIADRERLPCFLETCGPRNPDIYARYGFAVAGREELRTKAGDACEHPYIGMVRPAA